MRSPALENTILYQLWGFLIQNGSCQASYTTHELHFFVLWSIFPSRWWSSHLLSPWHLSSAPGSDTTHGHIPPCVKGSGAEQRLQPVLETSSSHTCHPQAFPPQAQCSPVGQETWIGDQGVIVGYTKHVQWVTYMRSCPQQTPLKPC